MKWIVTREYHVEADSEEDALQKVTDSPSTYFVSEDVVKDEDETE